MHELAGADGLLRVLAVLAALFPLAFLLRKICPVEPMPGYLLAFVSHWGYLFVNVKVQPAPWRGGGWNVAL